MGLTVSIYRSAQYPGNTPCNVFAAADELTIVNVDGPFSPRPDAPAAMLVAGNVSGIARVVPAVEVGNGQYAPRPGWHMAGGAYVSTSDSRFCQAVEAIVGGRFYGAVTLHDRDESLVPGRSYGFD